MKRIFIFLFLTACFIQLKAQNTVELFPGNLTIQPFTANILEPKLGFLFHSSENEVRLDIGNSLDIIRIDNCGSTFAFGADLFTYTRLRKEENFHFPVDAVDYLFGINFSYKIDLDEIEAGARLRLSHISAHMVDGHYENTLNIWRDNQNPRVYSREFLELMPYVRFNNLRIYTGFTYIFHIDPEYLKKDNYHFGFDYFVPAKLFGTIRPFFGYDLKLIHPDSYTANNSFIAGLKFGNKFGRGLSLYYQYYSGYSIHGEYFDKKVDYSAIGINLDL
jgi:hypothetical protein